MSSRVWKPEDAVPEFIKSLLAKESNNKALDYVLAFVQIVRLLKTQKRTGWIDHHIPSENVESISDHMYRMSVISMLIPNKSINIDKCVKIAVIHDIAEALVGDITPFDGVAKEEKHRREFLTIEYLASLIKHYNPYFAHEMVDLWLDYEEIRCIEARYVKDVDKYEMIQQAWDYEQEFGPKHNLDQFYLARSAIKTKEIGELCDEVIRQRSKFMEKEKKDE